MNPLRSFAKSSPYAKATVIVMVFAGFSILWISVTDQILGWLVNDPRQMIRLATYKGGVYIAIVAILLFWMVSAALQSASGTTSSVRTGRWKVLSALPLGGLFLGAILGTALVGWATYNHQRHTLEESAKKELTYLAATGRNRLESWLGERLKDAEVTAGDPLLLDQLPKSVHEGRKPSGGLLNRLQTLKRQYGYRRVSLLDPNGRSLVSTDPATSADIELPAANQIGSDTPARLVWKLEGLEPNLQVHVSCLAPLQGEASRYILLQLDFETLLASLAHDQPFFRRSSETFLICPQGHQMLFLSQTRNAAAPLTRVSLDRRELVGVQAILAGNGIYWGVDYRAVPSLAAAASLKNLPWMVLAKMDRAEITAPLARLAEIYLGVAILCLATMGFFILAWWQKSQAHQQSDRALIEAEKELLDQRLKSLSRHANDIVLLLDEHGAILDANDRALEAYGYSHEQLRRLSVKDLRTLDAASDFVSHYQTVMRERSIRFETVHVRKDGSSFPVEVSSRVFQQAGSVFIQSIIRDITERKKAEMQRTLTLEVLAILNQTRDAVEAAHLVLQVIQREIGVKAAAIRLADDGDFTYAAHAGFPEAFIQGEMCLRVRNERGEVCSDVAGNPMLECTCGLVVSGRTEPENPLFTVGGSAWTHDALALLDLPGDLDPRVNPRNQCIHSGYRSIALIPIRSNDQILGLLQLNDPRPGLFSLELIQFLEGMASTLGFALARRQNEDSLRRSEEGFRSLFASMAQGAFRLQADGTLLDINPAALRMLGVTQEEFLARTTGVAGWNVIREDGTPLSDGELPSAVALRTGEPVSGGVLGIHNAHTGAYVWVETNAIPEFALGSSLPQRVLVTLHDLTERKQVELNLLASERKYASLFNAIQEGFALHEIITDEAGKPQDYRFLDVNPAFEAMTGIPRDRWVGHTVREVLPGTEAHWVETYGRVALSGEPILFEEFSKDLGRWYQVYAFSPEPRRFAVLTIDITIKRQAEEAIREAEARYQALVFARDISERKQAELRILQANEELEQRVLERTAQLEAANREMEAFSYSVSHDLRAPLRGIDGFSKVLLEDYGDRLDAEGKHYLERVRQGTQQMGMLIEDLLELSRISRSELNRRSVDLSALAQKILAGLAQHDPDRSVQHAIAPGLKACGDPGLLNIALENLLNNAWKFTTKTPEARIELGSSSESGETVFFVRDNGAGFDMAFAGKLFNAFQRLHSRTDYEGTGIGLAIVQRVLHRHGGRIWVEASPNQGATFFFTLPA